MGFVQSNWAEIAGATSGGVALSSVASGADVTSGNTLLAMAVNVTTSTRTLTSFTDSKSNTWNLDRVDGKIAYSQGTGSATSVAAGATTITASWDFSLSFVIIAAEVSGYATHDTATRNSDATNDQNDNCASSFTTASGVFCVAGGVNNSNHGGHTAPGGWTMIQAAAFGGSSPNYAFAYIESALSSDSVTFTHTGNNRTWEGSVASYLSSGGGGSVVPIIHQQLMAG